MCSAEVACWVLRVLTSTPLAAGESVCVTGSSEQLGSWSPDQLLPMKPSTELSDNDDSVRLWSVEVQLPAAGGSLGYRYCICTKERVAENDVFTVERWESASEPRYISAEADRGEGAAHDKFGFINSNYQVDEGWLHRHSVIQLKLHSNNLRLWNSCDFSEVRLKVKAHCRTNGACAVSDYATSDSVSDNGSCLHEFKSQRVQISVLENGKTEFRDQSETGHAYSGSEFVVFQCRSTSAHTMDFTINLYSGSECGPVASAHVTAVQLNGVIGRLSSAIVSPTLSVIGEIELDYLVVKPLASHQLDMRRTINRHWPEQWRAQDIGHRGNGNSFSTDPDVLANVRENTLGSLRQAAEHGADWLEFDVQLTADHVPVLFHDQHVHVPLTVRHSDEPVQSGTRMLKLPVNVLTLKQLQQSMVQHVKEVEIGTDHLLYEDRSEFRSFPTLESSLTAEDIPSGYNVEVKWDMQLMDGSHEIDHPTELNVFVDTIVGVVLEHAGRRPIVFSAFHPDICTMLRLKQNLYPVLFLTQGQTKKWPPYRDPRTHSLEAALSFAQSAKLTGVDVFSPLLFERPEFVAEAGRQGLIVFCWGDSNANTANIGRLKALGCHGVIYDRITHYSAKKQSTVYGPRQSAGI